MKHSPRRSKKQQSGSRRGEVLVQITTFGNGKNGAEMRPKGKIMI